MWTSQSAMDLQVPVPTIDLAVAMRDLSGFKKRAASRPAQFLRGPSGASPAIARHFVDAAAPGALMPAMIITYAQGMALLAAASTTYGYHLDLEAVARIWRGGCIIRAALLEDIRAAYRSRPDLPNLLLDPELARKVDGPAGGSAASGLRGRRAGHSGARA